MDGQENCVGRVENLQGRHMCIIPKIDFLIAPFKFNGLVLHNFALIGIITFNLHN